MGNGSAEPLLVFREDGVVGQTAKERLVGSWTLVSLTAGEGADQALPYGPNPKGSMMVDANGRFMITVVRSDLPKFASNNRMRGTPDESNSVVQGSIAYYGTYTIDEATRVITVKLKGARSRTLPAARRRASSRSTATTR